MLGKQTVGICSACLLDRKRLCVDFDRYRVVEYVQIVRCFRCQSYGHMSSCCSGTQTCPRCAGEHRLADCTITTESCANCLREVSEADANHRVDSTDCPSFKNTDKI